MIFTSSQLDSGVTPKCSGGSALINTAPTCFGSSAKWVENSNGLLEVVGVTGVAVVVTIAAEVVPMLTVVDTVLSCCAS